MRAALLTVLATLAAPTAGAYTFFSIGAGDLTGAYFAAARAICEQVNNVHHGEMRCSPEATQGSVYNLTALRDGELDLALVQSDWQRRAVEGRSIFAAGGPATDLRAVMSLHSEPFTLLVRADAGMTGVADLRGRRVDLGHPSSGRRIVTDQILKAYGLGPDDFAETYELQSGAAISELCAGRIDATLLIIGHPNSGVRRALRDCRAAIAPLEGPEIEKLLAESGFYEAVAIPPNTYPETGGAIPTFGVTATMVARDDTPDAVVEAVVAATLDRLDVIARRAPVLRALDPPEMRENALSAPLHPAAERAFEAHAKGD